MGAYAINGKDLQQAFGIIVESGSDTLLQLPKPKPFYQYDWGEVDGVELDLTEPVVYAPRTVVLYFAIIATTEAQFWTNYQNFEAELRKPGVQKLYCGEAKRAYYLKYENSGNFRRLSRIVNPAQPIVAKFSITFLEPNPDAMPVPTPAPVPGEPELDTYQWGYSAAPILAAAYSTFAFQFTGSKGNNPSLDFTNAANYMYLIIQQPATATPYTNWTNTDKNYGTFPDQLFYGPAVQGAFRYYVSRVEVLLDKDNHSITLS